MSKPEYQPEEGTEGYVHVHVTEKQGQKLAEPQIEQYHPNVWAGVSKLAGFKGDVVHDPRTAAQKTAAAPLANTLKGSEKLETPEQYRERYKELFKEDAPFNMDFTSLKLTVDRANAKLADLMGGEKAATEEEKKAAEQQGAEGEQQGQESDKLPTTKKGWFDLFQQTFPDDTTAYEDITEKAIREKLGK